MIIMITYSQELINNIIQSESDLQIFLKLIYNYQINIFLYLTSVPKKDEFSSSGIIIS